MRFGTPTKLFGSGTEEEFELAHTKFLKDPNSIQYYFILKMRFQQLLMTLIRNNL